MGDTVLGRTIKDNDLGVTISADMKVPEQCGITASTGYLILGLVGRNARKKIYNAVFGVQYSEVLYHPSPGMVIAAQWHCIKIARTKPRFAGRTVYKKLSNEWTSVSVYYV